VRGVAREAGERVIGMVVVSAKDESAALLAVTENGYGKRTPLADYRLQGRGGKGLITIKCSDRNGPLLAIRDVHPGDELMVITRRGIMIRIGLNEVSEQGRNTQGVRIINLNDGDRVASIAKISREDAEAAEEAAAAGAAAAPRAGDLEGEDAEPVDEVDDGALDREPDGMDLPEGTDVPEQE
jgi:DNA gyrase subunit A